MRAFNGKFDGVRIKHGFKTESNTVGIINSALLRVVYSAMRKSLKNTVQFEKKFLIMA